MPKVKEKSTSSGECSAEFTDVELQGKMLISKIAQNFKVLSPFNTIFAKSRDY